MERNNKRTFKKIEIWVLKHQYINYKNFILNRVTTGCPISFVEKDFCIVLLWIGLKSKKMCIIHLYINFERDI